MIHRTHTSIQSVYQNRGDGTCNNNYCDSYIQVLGITALRYQCAVVFIFLIEHWAGNKYWVHVHFAVKHRDNFAFVCVVCVVFIQSPHSSWANNSSWMMICIAVIRECMSRENLKYITSAGDDTISRDGSRQWGFCAHLGRVLCANKIARKGRRRCWPYFA